MEIVDVQKLISEGQLKLVDTFVTDRAFEEFCRKHGSLINVALIDPSTRKWLVSEYGVPDSGEESKLARTNTRSSYARYFRHVRHCNGAANIQGSMRGL